MQPTSSISDYIEFKDEIMKKIRLLENKFTSEFNSKFSQISEGFEKLDMKINSLSQNNTSLIEFITKQNFNYEKFTDLVDFKIKADRELMTHDIKIKRIIEDIEKLKLKYDKILNDNLIVPGYVGPGGPHKNLAEYVIYQINEFQKIRNDTEQIRNRVDNAARIALSAVNTSFSQFQRYTDEKNKSTQIMIERKYNQFSDKILELETELNKYQYKIERQIKPIEVDIQKLIKIRNNQAISNEQTFDNIQQKMNKMIEEFDLIKSTNKEYDSKIINYRQTNNTSELLNSKNTSKYNKSPIINDNEFNNNSKNSYNRKKNNQKSQKNLVISYEFEQKNSSINQNELPKLNNDLGSPMRSNRNYIDYDKNIRHNSNNSLQEKKLISEKNIKKIDRNDGNEDNITNVKNKKNEKVFSPKVGFKENDKMKKIESKQNVIKNNDDIGRLNNKSIENEKFTKIGINKKIEKEKKKYIDEGTVRDYITQINENNNAQKSNKKIIINGLYKDKKTGTTDNLMDEIKKEHEKGNNSIYVAKFDKSENDKIDVIQKDANDAYDNNLYAENEKENNEINNNSNTLEIKNKNEFKKITYKINNNIKDNINFLSKTSKHSFLNKKEGNTSNEPLGNKKKYYNLEMNINEEQKQIMKKIRDYYQNKKIIMEKKLHENIVDCNIVNLNRKDSFDIINIKYKNSSAKSSLFNTTKSLMNENRNNLKDISMKLSPYLRRTNYKFFDKRNRMNSNGYRSFDGNDF